MLYFMERLGRQVMYAHAIYYGPYDTYRDVRQLIFIVKEGRHAVQLCEVRDTPSAGLSGKTT